MDSEFYDEETNKCMVCPEGTKYILELKKCIPFAQPLKCGNGQTYNVLTKRCECPQDVPYFDGKECIRCG